MGWDHLVERALQGAVSGAFVGLVIVAIRSLSRRVFYGYWWYGYAHPKGGKAPKVSLPPRKDDY